ncbi:MAG: ABC transporter substrate-binding protein [Armatimonadota bacterium]|nr:ABC transporter substrate-binding protein [Armatimonadota bacterium]
MSFSTRIRLLTYASARSLEPKLSTGVRFLVIILLLCLSALPAIGYPISIKDARGKIVIIKSAPRRIISLAPSNTEILFALGLDDRIVGVTTYCDYPPQAKKKPKIGDRIVNVEKVISLKPDLILAHGRVNDAYISQFEALGKTIIAIDPKTYEQTMSDIRMIGRVTGRSSKASVIVKKMQSVADRVRRAPARKTKPKVLMVIQPSPLWAAGPNTFVDEMVRYAHGSNIAYDSRPGFNQFPVERAISRNPDIIIVGKDQKEFFLTSPVWRGARAVKEKRVYEMDHNLLVRPGPRLADGLLKLAGLLR